jgi:lysophospholipase L1-like esterase
LYRSGKSYFEQLNEVRLDPLGLQLHASETVSSKKPDKKRVVFFGDSRALMWTFPVVEGFEFLNRGVGQQTTNQALLRFEFEVPILNPDVLIVELGVNDLKAIPVFPARKNEIVRNVKRNLVTIVEKSKKIGCYLVISSVFPLGKVPLVRQPFWSDDVKNAIEDVNGFIDSLRDERVVVIKTDDVLRDETGKLKTEYEMDLLHLNPAAYAAINDQKLVPTLKALR